MPKPLPRRPHLGYLRNQARDLLDAYRQGLDTARQLVAQYLPSLPPDRVMTLTDAQTVIARSYGFANWAQLKHTVEQARAAESPASPLPDAPTALRERAPTAYQSRIRLLAETIAGHAQAGAIGPLLDTLLAPRTQMIAVRADLDGQGLLAPVVDTLLAALEHPEPRVRFLAAHAMDHYADQRCVEPLRRALRDPVPRVRWAAIHSLSCDECKLAPLTVEGDLVGTLIELAEHDPSIRVRRVATYTLGQICADQRSITALQGILLSATDPGVLRNAHWALQQLERHSATSSCNHE